LRCEATIGRTAGFIKQGVERRRATAAISAGAADRGQTLETVAAAGDRRPDRVVGDSPTETDDHVGDNVAMKARRQVLSAAMGAPVGDMGMRITDP